MAEEKRGEKILNEDAWKKAINSWRDRVSGTDFDELDTPLRADIVEKLHRKHKTPKES